MKKFLLFIIVASIPIFYSCDEKSVAYEDSGKTIELFPGQYLKVVLPANASTGNIWRKSFYDNKIIGRSGKPNYMLGDDGAIGSSATMTFRFKALKEGKTTLKMLYGNRFDEQAKPLKEFILEIVVVNGH
jgi:predicted secreted protein